MKNNHKTRTESKPEEKKIKVFKAPDIAYGTMHIDDKKKSPEKQLPYWGLLGRDVLFVKRRVRGLGLGASVRYFNEQAVPGLGGLRFGKQLLWALLGIQVATECRRMDVYVKNIEVANAIEAMSCLKVLQRGAKKPGRILGQNKLQGHREDDTVPFTEARRPSFYVTQPMRMGTVQPLLALGLVESSTMRFNDYRLSGRGITLLKVACSSGGHTRGSNIYAALVDWVRGTGDIWKDKSPKLFNYLDPEIPLPSDACSYLMGLLQQSPRRRDALKWMAELHNHQTPQDREYAPDCLTPDQRQALQNWEHAPDCLTSDHWQALHAGACLFSARDAALAVLNSIESQVGNSKSRKVSIAELVKEISLEDVQKMAREFLALQYHEPESQKFCQECLCGREDVLRNLLLRDNLGLCLEDNAAVPGAAFHGDTVAEEDGEDATAALQTVTALLPANISFRMVNLCTLYTDLQ